jgi:hypothetical protein
VLGKTDIRDSQDVSTDGELGTDDGWIKVHRKKIYSGQKDLIKVCGKVCGKEVKSSGGGKKFTLK